MGVQQAAARSYGKLQALRVMLQGRLSIEGARAGLSPSCGEGHQGLPERTEVGVCAVLGLLDILRQDRTEAVAGGNGFLVFVRLGLENHGLFSVIC